MHWKNSRSRPVAGREESKDCRLFGAAINGTLGASFTCISSSSLVPLRTACRGACSSPPRLSAAVVNSPHQTPLQSLSITQKVPVFLSKMYHRFELAMTSEFEAAILIILNSVGDSFGGPNRRFINESERPGSLKQSIFAS